MEHNHHVFLTMFITLFDRGKQKYMSQGGTRVKKKKKMRKERTQKQSLCLVSSYDRNLQNRAIGAGVQESVVFLFSNIGKVFLNDLSFPCDLICCPYLFGEL